MKGEMIRSFLRSSCLVRFILVLESESFSRYGTLFELERKSDHTRGYKGEKSPIQIQLSRLLHLQIPAAFSFARVQQSRTTLAGASPVTVFASELCSYERIFEP